MIAKYLAMSLAMENVVSAPRVISNCLPISTISRSACGIGVQIDHVAGLFGRRRAGVHRNPTSACASAGASLVLSPVIATSLPPACSRLMIGQSCPGRGFGEEVVHTGLVGNRLGGHGLSPVIITVRMPIFAHPSNRLTHTYALFDDVFGGG